MRRAKQRGPERTSSQYQRARIVQIYTANPGASLDYLCRQTGLPAATVREIIAEVAKAREAFGK